MRSVSNLTWFDRIVNEAELGMVNGEAFSILPVPFTRRNTALRVIK